MGPDWCQYVELERGQTGATLLQPNVWPRGIVLAAHFTQGEVQRKEQGWLP